MLIKERINLRLRDYDYSQRGGYFVTVCVKNMECVLGKVVNEKMELSRTGEIASKYWMDISNHFNSVEIDEFVVMPNHVHGIIMINGLVGAGFTPAHAARNLGKLVENWATARVSPTLSQVIGSYKSLTTNKVHNENLHNGKLWQRSFYDRVIRSDEELNRVREYILNNPVKWENGEEVDY